MISFADVEKLRGLHAPEPSVLSLYLPVPLDTAGLRGLTARAGDMMNAVFAGCADGVPVAVSDADSDAVLGVLAAHGRDWLGLTVAIFVSGQLDLLETVPLRCRLPERAVLAVRPHVRPLLAALQRCPDYYVAVADRRHSSVLLVSGESVRVAWSGTSIACNSPVLGDSHGLDSLHASQRIRPADDHYRDTAATLEQAAVDRKPLVVGGYQDAIDHLLRALPPLVMANFADGFTADPRTLTAATMRDFGGTVIDRWTARRERQLVEEILSTAPGCPAAVSLPACLAGVNAGAVRVLVIPEEGMIPGFDCGRCGALSTGGDDCPDWGTATQAVPDLLEEMAWRTLDDGGQVITVRDAPVSIAAKLTSQRSAVPMAAA